MDPIDRYHNDAIYRGLVFMMKKMVKDGSVTGNDLIEAAELARDLSEEEAALDCLALRQRAQRLLRERPACEDAVRQLNRRCAHGGGDKWNGTPF